MQIELTGKEDRQGPWKIALAGPPGSGKTLTASTAPTPLFVFFQQEPRIKSVADRAVPHVKITNNFVDVSYALSQVEDLIRFLRAGDHGYETLVIDTGDELFQQMKAGRTHENGGEFSIGDWGWIGDAYREVMLGIIDLPLNIVVTFHTKSVADEAGSSRELMLQGSAKDEASGWFDIVGALDTYTLVDESGRDVTRRVVLTSSSRMFPWVKDHSGALPFRFELSDGFVDDIPRILSLVTSRDSAASREVVQVIEPAAAPVISGVQAVPSPEDLDARKAEAHVVPVPEVAEVVQLLPEVPEAVEAVPEVVRTEQPVVAEPDEGQLELDAAVAATVEVLGAVEVCSHLGEDGVECGVAIDDESLAQVTQIRFRTYLCRTHFKERLAES